MTINSLRSLPSLPSVARVRALTSCSCGCGQTTSRTYAPGHDARMKGLIVRLVRGIMDEASITEFGGEVTWKAVERHLADRARMAAWNLADEVAAWMEAREAEREEAAS